MITRRPPFRFGEPPEDNDPWQQVEMLIRKHHHDWLVPFIALEIGLNHRTPDNAYADAQDLAQEVWLQVHGALARGETIRYERAYLQKVAINVIATAGRKGRLRRDRGVGSLDGLDFDQPATSMTQPRPPTADEIYRGYEAQDRLIAALRALKDDCDRRDPTGRTGREQLTVLLVLHVSVEGAVEPEDVKRLRDPATGRVTKRTVARYLGCTEHDVEKYSRNGVSFLRRHLGSLPGNEEE